MTQAVRDLVTCIALQALLAALALAVIMLGAGCSPDFSAVATDADATVDAGADAQPTPSQCPDPQKIIDDWMAAQGCWRVFYTCSGQPERWIWQCAHLPICSGPTCS